jgi:MFS family permease
MPPAADSRYAWARLIATLALMTVGSAGMYVVSVVLPAVQAEFGVARADASLPYTLLMVGFGIGGVWMGRLADRHGVTRPILIGAAGLACGFIGAALSSNVWLFAIAHGVGIGLLGSSATFAPLVADTSLWFVRRRGIAVAICASGNYIAGALWPPIVQHFVETVGWRPTYIGLGVLCAVTLPLLSLAMRPRPPAATSAPARAHFGTPSERPFGLSLGGAQAMLCIAGVACCVAMSMPQVHIVAYCGDLG